jgi:integrase
MCASKVAFTEPRVQRFECAEGKKYTLHWDEDTPGMGLRVTNTGARSYVFEKRVHGHTRRVTIGDPRSWKLHDARVEARRLATLVDRKIDPKDEAAAKRAQADADRLESQRHTHVVSTVWHVYIDANKAKWGKRHLEDHISLAQLGGERKKKGGGKGLTKPGPLAALMPLKLSELSSETVAAWLEREAKSRPTSAAGAYRLLRAFIRWAGEMKEYKGIVPADAYMARVVRDVIPESRAKEGDCLQREQLPGWFKEVRARPNPIVAAYLQGLLLLGPRREELAEVQWTDVTFGMAPSLVLRDKVDGERTIPLPPYMASLLKELPRKNRWVFYSEEAESGHIEEPTKAHVAALEAAGLPHVTLHGLRRSFGTLAEWVEIPTGVVAQIQGHKPSAIAEKHYRRRPLDLLRMWHEKLEVWMLEQAGVSFTRTGEKPRLGVVSTDGSVKAVA